MLKKYLRKQITKVVLAAVLCLIMSVGLIANIVLPGGEWTNVLMIVVCQIGPIILYILVFKMKHQGFIDYFKSCNDPRMQMEKINDFCDSEKPVSNTWISDEFIVYIDGNIIVDATKLLWAYVNRNSKPDNKGNTRRGCFVDLALSDGNIVQLEYTNLFNARRVMNKLEEKMPYIYFGYTDENDEMYHHDMEAFIYNVEQYKAMPTSSEFHEDFKEKGLYGNRCSDFKSYKKSQAPGIIKKFLNIIGIMSRIVVAFMGVAVVFTSISDLHINITVCSEPVEATIVDMDYYIKKVNHAGNKSHRSYVEEVEMCIPSYEFEADNGEIIEVNPEKEYRVDEFKKEVGDTVTYYYEPGNPEHCYNRNDIPGDIGVITMEIFICWILMKIIRVLFCDKVKKAKIVMQDLEHIEPEVLSMLE